MFWTDKTTRELRAENQRLREEADTYGESMQGLRQQLHESEARMETMVMARRDTGDLVKRAAKRIEGLFAMGWYGPHNDPVGARLQAVQRVIDEALREYAEGHKMRRIP